MSVSRKKPVAGIKEAFLAIALIAGEVSSTTVRKMKADFGKSKITNHVIYKLSKKNYIQKLGTGNDYSFRLTEEGRDYLMIKCPGKYHSKLYVNGSSTVFYDKNSHTRHGKASLVLYAMWREGIDISASYDKFNAIVNGNQIHIETPFFVSLKAIKKYAPFLNYKVVGTRLYGVVVSEDKILIVYYPDKDNHIIARTEVNLLKSIDTLFSRSISPYNDKNHRELLYLFDDNSNIKDSFIYNNKPGKNQPATRRFYEANPFVKSHIYLLNGNSYSLFDILYDSNYQNIYTLFQQYFELESVKQRTTQNILADGIYENGYTTYQCWTLSPAKILEVFRYCNENKSDSIVLFLCFSEQVDTLQSICSIAKLYQKRTYIAHLPKEGVYGTLEGKYESPLDIENP